jgi:hypothetical protein
MTRAVPLTMASLRRALKVAREQGLRLVVQADGSMTFVRDDDRQQQPESALERDGEIVL